jgi:chromosome segregation ATPase
MQDIQPRHQEALISRDEKNEKLREENTALKSEIEELQNSAKDLKVQILTLKGNLQAAVEGGLSNSNAPTEAQTEYENARDVERRTVAQLEWDRVQAEAKPSTQESKLSLLSLSNNELKSQNAKLLESQNTHAQEKNELQAMICALEKSVDNSKSRTNDLLDDQKGSIKEIDKLQLKLKQAESNITTLDTELTSTRKSSNENRARNTELVATQTKHKQEINQLKNDNRINSGLKTEYYQEKSRIEKDLAEVQSKKSAFQKQLKAQGGEMNKKLEEVKAHNGVLEKKAGEYQKEVERLKNTVTTMELVREEQRKEREHKVRWITYVVVALLVLLLVALLRPRPDLWSFD